MQRIFKYGKLKILLLHLTKIEHFDIVYDKLNYFTTYGMDQKNKSRSWILFLLAILILLVVTLVMVVLISLLVALLLVIAVVQCLYIMCLCFCCLHRQKRHLQVNLFILPIVYLQKRWRNYASSYLRTHYKFTICLCQITSPIIKEIFICNTCAI